MRKKLRERERRFNSRLLDWIIGGSYLGDYRPKIFMKIKKIGLEAYAHILSQYEKFKERYRD